ncbi:MAG: hypothetical protein JO257_12535 [Deltaproteobacteria bacterium]|nr:hypothetical protein [Deltaproteobacteria bacterium]
MRSLLVPTLLLGAACSSAYADRVAVPAPVTPLIAIDTAPAKVRAPYDVQVVREDGETAPTYALKDRFYVQGSAGERYTIRVTNPTARRVEAVVSVDGLDVVDGDPGDLRKRGYIVPAYGEVRIEGFRTSLDDVATFRFSSVDGSYAGQKGKARNVGVIAVAIFEEQAPPEQQIIVEPAPPHPYRYEDDLDARAPAPPADHAAPRGGYAKADAAKSAGNRAAPPPPPTTTTAGAGGVAQGRPAEAPRMKKEAADEEYGGDADYVGGITEAAPPPTNRPGLGTEYGESRYSAASYTRFNRAANRPIAIAELRYNDAAGLTALGIPVAPMPDEGELMTRETADPFPGDGHFARPVR